MKIGKKLYVLSGAGELVYDGTTLVLVCTSMHIKFSKKFLKCKSVMTIYMYSFKN